MRARVGEEHGEKLSSRRDQAITLTDSKQLWLPAHAEAVNIPSWVEGLDGGGAQDAPSLPEKLLVISACCGSKSIPFTSAGIAKSPMFQEIT